MKPSQWPLIQRYRNAIPGPFLAKISPLWKIWHVLRGTYRKAVQKLHARYGIPSATPPACPALGSQFTGALVQVGPNEYSLADKGLVYIPKLTPSSFAIDLNALQQLEQSVSMANVFLSEYMIEKCNHQLLCLLENAAETGESMELSPLLARYAYEAMLATTTGQFAGFLEQEPDGGKIQKHMKDWKFYAVLYGSYLKYHPFILKILSKCGLRGGSQDDLFEEAHSTRDTEAAASDAAGDNHGQREEQRKLLSEDIEARIALTLAGADPAVTLMRTALIHIYSDLNLLQQLREEILNATLSETPSFKELIAERGNMPLLHAVLLECIRLSPPMETGPTYTTREDDVPVAGRSMPKGVSCPASVSSLL